MKNAISTFYVISINTANFDDTYCRNPQLSIYYTCNVSIVRSRQCNFSSSRRYMDRSPRFLHQMAHKLLRLICPYLPHNNLRLRREVAFTRAYPVDCPERTYRPLS